METGDAIADKHSVCEAEWFMTVKQARKELVFKELEFDAFSIVFRELPAPSELQFQGYLAAANLTSSSPR